MGDLDSFLYALVIFVTADYVTGLLRAAVTKTVNSKIGLKGIIKKIVIFALVGIAHTIDRHLIGDGSVSVMRTAVIFFFISNEGISITENAARMGLPVPKKLIDVMEQLKKVPE